MSGAGLSATQAAKVARVPVAQILQALADKSLPSMRVGGFTRIDAGALETWRKEHAPRYSQGRLSP